MLLLAVAAPSAQGAMTFDRTDVYVGTAPSAVETADLDGDESTDDVVVANRDNDTITILLGQDDGTLALQGTYPVGDGPVAVDIGNYDGGNRRNDIVVANTVSQTISVYLNDDNGIPTTAAP